jgi:transcriptional regulator with XRE-family HTH domain
MPRKPKFTHPLRTLRAALGKSQPQFAKMFGVSASYMQAVELGQRKLNDELADAIMLRLGVDAESLKGRRSMPKPLLLSARNMKIALLIGDSPHLTLLQKFVQLLNEVRKVGYPRLEKKLNSDQLFYLFQAHVKFWEKQIAPNWEWSSPYHALNSKLEILFEAAKREKKHFTLAMRLSRWIEKSANEFRLRTTINAITGANSARWPSFMQTLADSFNLPQRQRRKR